MFYLVAEKFVAFHFDFQCSLMSHCEEAEEGAAARGRRQEQFHYAFYSHNYKYYYPPKSHVYQAESSLPPQRFRAHHTQARYCICTHCFYFTCILGNLGTLNLCIKT